MDTKALRQKILDLAIRGKLVPQDPTDEPAVALLERIRRQKEQMVKEGKLKAKDIKDDTTIFKGEDNLHYEKFADGTVKCIEDEIPFDLPKGWAWTRLRNICSMCAGKSKPTSEIKDEYFENSYPCFGGNGIRGYVDSYMYDGTYHIIGRQGALCGNIKIAKNKFYATEHAVVVSLFDGIDFLWSNHTLEGLNINQYATGAAQPGLSVANVLNILLACPPSTEQIRIASSIDKAIQYINEIDANKCYIEEVILSLKSRILDLAIRGKLVPQDPNDEPASVLLERIRAEKEALIKAGKIKRDKKESVIFRGEDNSYYEKIGGEVKCIDDEIPFDLPDGWCYIKLCELLEYEQPTQYIVESTKYNNAYPTPVLTAGKTFIIGYTNETNGIKSDLPVIIFDDFTTDNRYIDFPFKVKSSAMKILSPASKMINLKYAYYMMQCVDCDHYNHQRYWISDFSQKIVALPPIAEQHRILEVIEKGMSLLEQANF